MRPMKTVIFVKGLDKYPDRMKLAGAADYARAHGWDLLPVERLGSRAKLKAVIDLWSPDGFIVNRSAGLNNLPPSAYGKVPVVFFSFPDAHDGHPVNRVYNDAVTPARLAARTLLRLDLASYGYVNWFKPVSWSEARQRAFSEAMSLHGKSVAVFTPRRSGPTSVVRELVPWLKRLPRPVGIFAADDFIALPVANACKLAGLAIPDDVALIGVGNDIDTCESTTPSLTSITHNHVESGRLAAQLLDRAMSGRLHKPTDITYPCGEVVHRGSTRRFARSDRMVLEILERIRREACAGLTAANIVRSAPCSRRVVETRFRKATGKSILEEIRSVRLQRATELLSNRNLADLSFVAHQTGYATLPAFSAFFKAETGMSPLAWRKAHAPR